MNNETRIYKAGAIRNGDMIAHRGQMRTVESVSDVLADGEEGPVASIIEFPDAPSMWLREGEEYEVPYRGIPEGGSEE